MERQRAKTAKDAKEEGIRAEPPEHLDRLAHAVIGAAIEVHTRLGPGFLEHIYEEAVAIELGLRGIPFTRQVCFPVHYKGVWLAESRLDLLVADELVVELKSVEELRPIHRAQVLSYLRAGAFQLGLLFNFNVNTLPQGGMRRIISSG